MHKHRGLIVTILVLTSALVGMFMIEGAMNFIGLDYARVWEPDAELGWHHVAGARRLWTEEGRGLIEINSLGQRDKERALPKPKGTYRIVVYGDSMTEAVQVDLEQTFTSLLEKSLAQKGHHVEVLNLGVNGYSPIQELLLLKREGKKYEADLVVLATYLDNDVSGSHPALNVSQGGVPFYGSDRESGGFNFTQTLASYEDYHREPLYTVRYYSRIYRWLSAVRWQLKASERRLPSGEIPQRYLFYGQSHTQEWMDAWALYERALNDFALETARQGSGLVILSVPAPWVSSPQAWNLILNSNPTMKDKVWSLAGPEQRLEEFAKSRGWRLLAPHGAFGEAWSSEEPLYWSHLGHMTPRGHQVMARVLEEYLTREQLVSR